MSHPPYIDTGVEANTDEWLAERQTVLGGSDKANILGIDGAFGTPLDVYLSKTLPVEPCGDEPERFWWGHRLEAPVIDWYERQTGRHVVRSCMLRSVANPWMGASPDGLVCDPCGQIVGGLEVKTVSPYRTHGWGGSGTDEIPLHYRVQCAHYMAVTHLPWWDLVAFFHRDDVRLYRIGRDLELETLLVEAGRAFWTSHVLAGVPPDPANDEERIEAIRRRFPTHKGDDLREATDEDAALASAYADAKRTLVEAESAEAAAKAALIAAIGDAPGINGDGWRVTWKASKPCRTTSWKSIAKELSPPEDLVERHTKVGDPSRRFLFKEDVE